MNRYLFRTALVLIEAQSEFFNLSQHLDWTDTTPAAVSKQSQPRLPDSEGIRD